MPTNLAVLWHPDWRSLGRVDRLVAPAGQVQQRRTDAVLGMGVPDKALANRGMVRCTARDRTLSVRLCTTSAHVQRTVTSLASSDRVQEPWQATAFAIAPEWAPGDTAFRSLTCTPCE